MGEPLPRHVSSAILMAAIIGFVMGIVVVPEAISQPYFLVLVVTSALVHDSGVGSERRSRPAPSPRAWTPKGSS